MKKRKNDLFCLEKYLVDPCKEMTIELQQIKWRIAVLNGKKNLCLELSQEPG